MQVLLLLCCSRATAIVLLPSSLSSMVKVSKAIVKEGETNKHEGGKKAASRIAFVKRKNSVDFSAAAKL